MVREFNLIISHNFQKDRTLHYVGVFKAHVLKTTCIYYTHLFMPIFLLYISFECVMHILRFFLFNHLSQPFVSRCVAKVSRELANWRSSYIAMPTEAEALAIHEDFFKGYNQKAWWIATPCLIKKISVLYFMFQLSAPGRRLPPKQYSVFIVLRFKFSGSNNSAVSQSYRCYRVHSYSKPSLVSKIPSNLIWWQTQKIVNVVQHVFRDSRQTVKLSLETTL